GGPITKGPSEETKIVYPSGFEFFAETAPMAPPAPGLLSTTKVCLKVSWSFGCTERAIMSVDPPGGKGTIIVTGFEGQACASAPVAARPMTRAASAFRMLSILREWLLD